MNCIWKCILPKKKGQWDNEYYFYDDGSIKHFYDKSVKQFNLEEVVLATQISKKDRDGILNNIDKCPYEWRNFILKLLN